MYDIVQTINDSYFCNNLAVYLTISICFQYNQTGRHNFSSKIVGKLHGMYFFGTLSIAIHLYGPKKTTIKNLEKEEELIKTLLL